MKFAVLAVFVAMLVPSVSEAAARDANQKEIAVVKGALAERLKGPAA